MEDELLMLLDIYVLSPQEKRNILEKVSKRSIKNISIETFICQSLEAQVGDLLIDGRYESFLDYDLEYQPSAVTNYILKVVE